MDSHSYSSYYHKQSTTPAHNRHVVVGRHQRGWDWEHDCFDVILSILEKGIY
jgi:hypothetical protein